MTYFSWKDAKQVIDFWLATAPSRPKWYNEDLNITGAARLDSAPTTTTPNIPRLRQTLALSIGGVYVVPLGQSNTEAMKAIQAELQPLVRLAGGGHLHVEPSTFEQTMETFGEHRHYLPFSKAQILFSSHLIDVSLLQRQFRAAAAAAAAVPVETRTTEITSFYLFGIELMGGHISQVAPTETAFVSRQATFMYDVGSYWNSALYTPSNLKWVSDTFNGIYNPLNPRSDQGHGHGHGYEPKQDRNHDRNHDHNHDHSHDHVYIGFPINGLSQHERAYWGINRHRLRQIKARVDPLKVLHFPTGLVV